MILLQIRCVELNTLNVTFEANFESLNDDQYICCLRYMKRSCGHQRWVEDPTNPLTKVDRAYYAALILQQILKFLKME